MATDSKERKVTLTGYIRWLYLRAKAVWAAWMTEYSQRLGRKGLLIALILFTGVFGSLCIALTLWGGSLFYRAAPIQTDAISTIRAPGAPLRTSVLPDTLLPNQLKAFRCYMHNLEATDKGRKTRDSLLRARPGLIDSVRMAEAIYTNNKDIHYEK